MATKKVVYLRRAKPGKVQPRHIRQTGVDCVNRLKCGWYDNTNYVAPLILGRTRAMPQNDSTAQVCGQEPITILNASVYLERNTRLEIPVDECTYRCFLLVGKCNYASVLKGPKGDRFKMIPEFITNVVKPCFHVGAGTRWESRLQYPVFAIKRKKIKGYASQSR